ncbi:ABC transporter permease subunit [Nonomuraea mesophila]|uniref:ABC transporter permease subunit n=1 Tax=Nonomuraea mesophila TaxID=2530382 RepID=A0A4R5FS96_9ACTN|nr:ABC transporter permease subunit [Nonomuraea mesophila]TDE56075.1 ABC transporter permease subunit [Nonomuraea mesophila]
MSTRTATPRADSGLAGRAADLWRRTVPWRWLTPSTVLIAGVIGFPALYMVWMSFLDISRIGLVTGMAGLDNYARLLSEDALGLVVGNTLLWLVFVVGLTMLLSLALAQFLAKDFFGRKLVRLALVVPWATSLVMTATVWRFIYEGGNGLLNRLLMDLSIISAPVDWYKDPATALYSVMAVGIITSMPFTTYVLLSGLQTVPHDVLEAARIDGASAWATWRRVTLPILRPSVMIALVLNMLHVFNAFTVIWVIMGKTAGNHADTTVTWLYKIAFTAQLDAGEAAALGVLNVAFLLLLILAFVLVLRPHRDPSAGSTPSAPSPTTTPSPTTPSPAALPPAVPERAPVASQAGPTARPSRSPAPGRRRGRPAALARAGRGWRRIRPVVLPVVGFAVALFFIAPYAAMLFGSLKTDAELFAVPADYLPETWAWSNYADVWRRIPLADLFRVSLTIALASTVLVLVLAAPAAYVLARMRFRGRTAFLSVILVTQMFPAVALLIGLYRQAVFIDGINSYGVIIAINSAFNLAFAVWILHAHFSAIPVEIDEAAMMDGLGKFRIMLRMILPLAAPGLVTVMIFTFIQVWNEFVIALTLFNDPAGGRVPLTVGVQQFIGLYETNYQYLFAAALMAIVPAVILFAFIEKHLVSGLTAGSTK